MFCFHFFFLAQILNCWLLCFQLWQLWAQVFCSFAIFFCPVTFFFLSSYSCCSIFRQSLALFFSHLSFFVIANTSIIDVSNKWNKKFVPSEGVILEWYQRIYDETRANQKEKSNERKLILWTTLSTSCCRLTNATSIVFYSNGIQIFQTYIQLLAKIEVICVTAL